MPKVEPSAAWTKRLKVIKAVIAPPRVLALEKTITKTPGGGMNREYGGCEGGDGIIINSQIQATDD